jgi:hypothetical protein
LRSTLARWFLLVAAVGLVLLGRPTEELVAQQYDDEQASRTTADDVSLRSARRHTPVFRLARTRVDDDALNVDLPESWRIDVLVATARGPAFASAALPRPCFQWSSSVSARGPPAIHS